MPPLYKITQSSKSVYARDDRHRDEIMAAMKPTPKIDITRFKGLGEMNAPDLKSTTMDKSLRMLLRVEVGDGERTMLADLVNALMGSKPEARFRFIQENAAFAKGLDI